MFHAALEICSWVDARKDLTPVASRQSNLYVLKFPTILRQSALFRAQSSGFSVIWPMDDQDLSGISSFGYLKLWRSDNPTHSERWAPQLLAMRAPAQIIHMTSMSKRCYSAEDWNKHTQKPCMLCFDYENLAIYYMTVLLGRQSRLDAIYLQKATFSCWAVTSPSSRGKQD